MPKNCFVPGCKTVFKNRCNRKPGEKTLTFFSAPKDPVLRKQWHIASRRGDREMTVKDVICELHFTEDCLLRYFTTELHDGSVFKLERGRPALKKGSVPTLFSFSESKLSSKRGKRKTLCTVQNEDGEIRRREGNTGEKNRRRKLPKSLQIDMYDSSDSGRNESYSTEIRDFAVRDSDEDEVPLTETDSSVQEENDEIPEQISSSDEDMPSTSENLIAEGHENIFGKFVASELRILSCDPPLYLRTKEKIWRVLEETSRIVRMRVK